MDKNKHKLYMAQILSQLMNAYSSIDVTSPKSFIVLRPDPAKACTSICFTDTGREIFSNLSQQVNALTLIASTPLGIFISSRRRQLSYLLLVDYQYYTF